MASATRNSKGFVRVVFTSLAGKRRTIYCGEMSLSNGKDIAQHVDAILTSGRTRGTLAQRTADWLGEIGDDFYEKLERVGLVGPRERENAPAVALLGKFLDSYIAKRVDAKPSSRLVFGRARNHLVKYFGADRPLNEITEGAAEDFALYLTGKGMAEATVRKMCGVARQFLKSAVKHKLITTNPFDAEGIRTTVKGNASRFRFITAEESDAVLQACPDAQWRLIFSLSRWGGLRCPSEHLALTLDHVDWANDRIIVPQPKVAHHGTPERVIPLFPELRGPLMEVAEAAPPGTKWLITRYRDATANMRTQFERIIRKAGLTPWPRLFHNLRATRQTELSDRFPQHVVCQWLGNSEQVAGRHYLNTTTAHFSQALENDAPTTRKTTRAGATGAGADGREPKSQQKTPCIQGVVVKQMDDTRLELVTSTMSVSCILGLILRHFLVSCCNPEWFGKTQKVTTEEPEKCVNFR